MYKKATKNMIYFKNFVCWLNNSVTILRNRQEAQEIRFTTKQVVRETMQGTDNVKAEGALNGEYGPGEMPDG